MEIIVLGSGTLVTTEKATAGYLVKTDEPFIMDMGRGTFSNLCKIQNRNEIGHILISHHHVDHYSDLLPFLQTAVHESKERQRKDLTIVGPLGSKELFGTILNLPGLKEGKFTIHIKEVSNETFAVGNTHVTAKEVRHVDNLRCLGYRVEYDGKSIAYSGDSRLCDEVIELCKNVDVAVLDCSAPKGFPKEHHLGRNHLGVLGCGEVAKKAGVKKLVLSHLYPACECHDLIKECREVFSGEIVVAQDLMRITI